MMEKNIAGPSERARAGGKGGGVYDLFGGQTRLDMKVEDKN